MNPLVSVIVPTYNGISRGFLPEAAASVLAQTFKDFELIIVDDGSKDNIAAGLGDMAKDPRVRIVRQDNQGLSAARKTGVERAKGRYIALLDDDDRWLPEKLQAQVDFMQGHPDARLGMVFCGVRLIDAQGKVIGARSKSAAGDMYGRLVKEGNCITAPSAVVIKKDAIDEAGNFDPAMRSLEDMDLWLRIARKRHIYAMPEFLADYRLHDNTITAKDFSREEEYEKKLYVRILASEPGLDPKAIWGRVYGRFAIRHFSLGNYARARQHLQESGRYGFWWDLRLLQALTFLPAPLLDGLKSGRRRLKGMKAGAV